MSYRGKSLGSCTWRLSRRAAASSHLVASGINFKPMNEFFRDFANQLQTARFGKRRVVQRRKIDEEESINNIDKGMHGPVDTRSIVASGQSDRSSGVRRFRSRASFRIGRGSIQPASRKPRYICPIRSIPDRSCVPLARNGDKRVAL